MSLKILAIDTSIDACSAALWNDGALITRFAIAPQKQSKLILSFVKEVLEEGGLNGVKQLDAIAVALGPGSFTGVRLAASVAQGLALAGDLPVVPLSTLRVMAQGAYTEYKYAATNVLVALDAKMQQIYWGLYSIAEDDCMAQTSTSKDKLGMPQEVEIPKTLAFESMIGVGDGWQLYEDDLRLRCKEVSITLEVVKKTFYPHAADVARLGVIAYNKGQMVAAEKALPVYLRDELYNKNK